MTKQNKGGGGHTSKFRFKLASKEAKLGILKGLEHIGGKNGLLAGTLGVFVGTAGAWKRRMLEGVQDVYKDTEDRGIYAHWAAM